MRLLRKKSPRSRLRSTINPADVTAVVLALNEAARIGRTLRSLPQGMPALVVDHQSMDDTVRIAEACGARVIVRPFGDFVTERRFALNQVRTPWTLMIDADETLDATLRQSIVESSTEPDGYEVLRTTLFCGRALRMWRDEPLLRLFRRDRVSLEARPAAGGAAQLHERWVCTGPVRRLRGTLLHDSYPSIAAYERKFSRYTTVEARGLRRSASALGRAFMAAPVRLAALLVLRGAASDGWRGWYVALRSAAYPLVVQIKAFAGR